MALGLVLMLEMGMILVGGDGVVVVDDIIITTE